MKKLNMVLGFVVSTLFMSVSTSAFAGTSEITWTEPDEYTDIRPGNHSRKNFNENLFANFDKFFTKLAGKLPEGYVYKMDVTNVDLAGDVNIGGINRTRIITDLYPPRFKFSYLLTDATGTVIQQGEEDLRDMGFMTGIGLRYKNDSWGHDKYMLDKWFNATFKDLMVESED